MEQFLRVVEFLFTNEVALTVIATIFGIVWTKIKTEERKRNLDFEKFNNVIELTVDSMYKNHVRDLKLANADGKLTDQERNDIMRNAKTDVFVNARELGINLFKLLNVKVDGSASKYIRYSKELPYQKLGTIVQAKIEKEVSKQKQAGGHVCQNNKVLEKD